MVEGSESSAVCLTYRDPRGAKRVTTCTAGGFTAARRPTYMLSLQAKVTHLYRDDTKQHGLISRNLKQHYSFI
jgi:hypothetical protein